MNPSRATTTWGRSEAFLQYFPSKWMLTIFEIGSTARDDEVLSRLILVSDRSFGVCIAINDRLLVWLADFYRLG